MRKLNKVEIPKPKTPWQYRKGTIDSRMRVAICLHIICGYPQTKAYEVAFDFKGKASSLAPLASRYFNSQVVSDEIYYFLFYFYPQGLHDKYYRFYKDKQTNINYKL